MGYWIYWIEKQELAYLKRWERFWALHTQLPVGDIVYLYDGSGIGWFAIAGEEPEGSYKQAAYLVQTPFEMLHMELLSRSSLRQIMNGMPLLGLEQARLMPISVEDGEWIMEAFEGGRAARPLSTLPQGGVQLPLLDQLDEQVDSNWQGPTEAERITIERLTQGIFRDRLMTYWEGACCVTGMTAPHFLRASHIKPWALAKDEERMDPHNGLLLAINFDFAFDLGLISFDDTGAVIIHPRAEIPALDAIGVRAGTRIRRDLCPAQCAYLEHHRKEVFGRWVRNPRPRADSPQSMLIPKSRSLS
jgi:hypothetical protein